jgi:hypothetical protein
METSEARARRRRHLAEEREALIQAARSHPGFEKLLMPKEFAEISNAAHSSTVVVMNVHDRRSDAIAIMQNTNHLVHIHMPLLADISVGSWCREISQSLLQTARDCERIGRPVRPRGTLESVLEELWTCAVHPILQALNIGVVSTPRVSELFSAHGSQRSQDASDLPRITWCATGQLTFLPFHAAGHYTDNHPESKVFNYVMSSYTPTLAALLSEDNDCASMSNGFLAVTEPSTLPGTTMEVNNIEQRLNSSTTRFTRLDKVQSTVDSVLQAMETHNWVHLACHAYQNLSKPTRSAFKLHDGELTLQQIMDKQFKGGEFAFLSSCETATGNLHLPDEVVHLAAGMLFAGYKTVIGTMWSIADNHAPTVADEVYKHLIDETTGKLDSSRAAYALHRALARLRREVGVENLAVWVPFIHMGI